MKILSPMKVKVKNIGTLDQGFSRRLYTTGYHRTVPYTGFFSMVHKTDPELELSQTFRFNILNQLSTIKESGGTWFRMNQTILNQMAAIESQMQSVSMLKYGESPSGRRYLQQILSSGASNKVHSDGTREITKGFRRSQGSVPVVKGHLQIDGAAYANASNISQKVDLKYLRNADSFEYSIVDNPLQQHWVVSELQRRISTALHSHYGQSLSGVNRDSVITRFIRGYGQAAESIPGKKLMKHGRNQVSFRYGAVSHGSVLDSGLMSNRPDGYPHRSGGQGYSETHNTMESHLLFPVLTQLKRMFQKDSSISVPGDWGIAEPSANMEGAPALKAMGIRPSVFQHLFLKTTVYTRMIQNNREAHWLMALKALNFQGSGLPGSRMLKMADPMMTFLYNTVDASEFIESAANQQQSLFRRTLTLMMSGHQENQRYAPMNGVYGIGETARQMKSRRDKNVRSLAKQEIAKVVGQHEKKLTLRLLSSLIKRFSRTALNPPGRKNRFAFGQTGRKLGFSTGVNRVMTGRSVGLSYGMKQAEPEAKASFSLKIHEEIRRVKKIFHRETEMNLKNIVTRFVRARGAALNEKLTRQFQDSNMLTPGTSEVFSDVARDEFFNSNPFRSYSVNNFMDYISLKQNYEVDGDAYMTQKKRNAFRLQREAEVHQSLTKSSAMVQLRRVFEQNLMDQYKRRLAVPYTHIKENVNLFREKMSLKTYQTTPVSVMDMVKHSPHHMENNSFETDYAHYKSSNSEYSQTNSFVHRTDSEEEKHKLDILRSETEKRFSILAEELQTVKRTPAPALNVDSLSETIIKKIEQRVHRDRQRRGMI